MEEDNDDDDDDDNDVKGVAISIMDNYVDSDKVVILNQQVTVI
jgi:hypothetical protein